MTTDPDDALVIRVLEGDQDAFTALVDRYHPRLVRLARAFVRDEASAEEVAQEAWEGVLRGLSGFEGRSSFQTWLFRILVNRARTRGVREARSVPVSALGDEDGDPHAIVDAARFDDRGMWKDPPRPWEVDTPEAIAGRAELMDAVAAAIDALPERQKAAVLLRDVEGLDTPTVCETLDVTEGNLRVLLHRARGAIRRALEARLEVPP